MLSVAALVVAASMVVGQTEGEKAFKSYADVAVGGTWTTTIGGQTFEDSYERILDGQFVRLNSKGAGPFPNSVTMIGIDPTTKNCTWWGFDASGAVSIGTCKQVSVGTWDFVWSGKGPQASMSGKGRLTKIDADTLDYEILEQKVSGDAKEFPSKSTWKRKR